MTTFIWLTYWRWLGPWRTLWSRGSSSPSWLLDWELWLSSTRSARKWRRFSTCWLKWQVLGLIIIDLLQLKIYLFTNCTSLHFWLDKPCLATVPPLPPVRGKFHLNNLNFCSPFPLVQWLNLSCCLKNDFEETIMSVLLSSVSVTLQLPQLAGCFCLSYTWGKQKMNVWKS